VEHMSTTFDFSNKRFLRLRVSIWSTPYFFQTNTAGQIFKLSEAFVKISLVCIFGKQFVNFTFTAARGHCPFIFTSSRLVCFVLTESSLCESQKPRILFCRDVLGNDLRSSRWGELITILGHRCYHLLTLISSNRGATLHDPLKVPLVKDRIILYESNGQVFSELRIRCKKFNNLLLGHLLRISVPRDR